MLTPRRYRGFEHLDNPATDAIVRERSLRDVRRSNALLGGAKAVMTELESLMPRLGWDATLLDVGTGLADIPARARHLGVQCGVRLTTIGLDGVESLARLAARTLDASTCGDALSLPFADASVDVVICSQVLHHFEEDDVARVLSELNRVARIAVIVSDLRRSWAAAAGFWLVAWPLSFHPVTRHDGMTSVLRGFTALELERSVRVATGARARVRRHLGYRLTATWSPSR